MSNFKERVHQFFPHLVEDAIAFDKLPKRCRADLHDLAPGHRGGCTLCARDKTTQARAEQGAL